MNYSITYIFTFVLLGFGVENADSVVNAVLTIAMAVGVLYGRYRAGSISWTGFKK